MQNSANNVVIDQAAPFEIPLDILLLADPSEPRIRSYLPACECFVARVDNAIVGACAALRKTALTYELMCIATSPAYQRSGIGAQLLARVIALCRQQGATALEVGTGSFGYPLRFYQKHGFRVSQIERNFFVDHYDEPIVEDGVVLKDMLKLVLSC